MTDDEPPDIQSRAKAAIADARLAQREWQSIPAKVAEPILLRLVECIASKELKMNHADIHDDLCYVSRHFMLKASDLEPVQRALTQLCSQWSMLEPNGPVDAFVGELPQLCHMPPAPSPVRKRMLAITDHLLRLLLGYVTCGRPRCACLAAPRRHAMAPLLKARIRAQRRDPWSAKVLPGVRWLTCSPSVDHDGVHSCSPMPGRNPSLDATSPSTLFDFSSVPCSPARSPSKGDDRVTMCSPTPSCPTLLFTEASLGCGTTGQVFRGYLLKGNNRVTEVAVKRVELRVLRQKASQQVGTSVAHMLRQEVDFLRSHRHPSFVCVHCDFQDDDYWYIVEEIATGGSVRDLLRAGKPLSAEQVQRLGRCLRDGVMYVHTLGVAHRDLKPDNLVLDRTRTSLKLIDFQSMWNPALASTTSSSHRGHCVTKACDEESLHEADCDLVLQAPSERSGGGRLRHRRNGHHRAHSVRGSPCYMAPELLQAYAEGREWLREGYDVTKVDLWSVGIVLFEMASGRLPWGSWAACANMEDSEASALLHKARCIDVQEATGEAWSPALRDLVTRLLHPDPRLRMSWDDFASHEWFGGDGNGSDGSDTATERELLFGDLEGDFETDVVEDQDDDDEVRDPFVQQVLQRLQATKHEQGGEGAAEAQGGDHGLMSLPSSSSGIYVSDGMESFADAVTDADPGVGNARVSPSFLLPTVERYKAEQQLGQQPRPHTKRSRPHHGCPDTDGLVERGNASPLEQQGTAEASWKPPSPPPLVAPVVPVNAPFDVSSRTTITSMPDVRRG